MGPYRAFLTGEPGCGKTTVITRLCERLVAMGVRLGGVISREFRERGVRLGFSLEDILTHETGILAHVNQIDGPRIGKYHVNLRDLERIGAAAGNMDLVIVDEIGPMELHSMPFILAVRAALASPKDLVGTIHKRAAHSLVTEIKTNSAYEIIEVTQNNRDLLPVTISNKISKEM
jgi:nucleoside-triphosphatase